jgi:F-type H+-transporting ATPase subunit delta
MSSQTIARRYARALFDIARPQGKLDLYAAALEQAAQALAANPELRRVLYHQLIPVREKQKLSPILFPAADPILQNFFRLVLARKRERELPAIASQFRRLVDQENRVLQVEVDAAAPLSAEVAATLQDKLATLTGRRIRLQVSVEPALMGGLIIRIGDRVLDASLKKKLELLGEHLKGATA